MTDKDREELISAINNLNQLDFSLEPRAEIAKLKIERVLLRNPVVSRKPVPVRYFVHDIDGESDPDSADAVECTESQFMEAAGLISYERHTVYANGVDQICLTKMPTL